MRWKLIQDVNYPINRQNKMGKKQQTLITNMLSNLATFKECLEEGVHPEQAKRVLSFIHDERKGLLAIDQRPPVGGPQLRLYIYPNINEKILHILGIGNKKRQSVDIQKCYRRMVRI